MAWTPLPIGIDNFEKMIHGNYYFVDKTLFIKELLDMKGEVNLFTRPRRFGKTLNLSMLRYFFDRENPDAGRIFTGTKIMDAGEKYLRHQGKYPVISITLKSMKQASPEAYADFIATMDTNVEAIEKSGLFSEIGKSGHDGGGASMTSDQAWATIEKKASDLMVKEPSLTQAQAIDRVCQANPTLAHAYENK